jgi:hypothetical protein
MNINMVITDRCKWAAWGFCRVTRIHGWNNEATNKYIQLHETPPLTAAGLVPANQAPNVKSFYAPGSNGFDYEFGSGISLAELTIAISTTEVNFTDPGASHGLDMTVELDTVFDVRSGDKIAGDLTTGRNSLQVWTNTSGPQKLLRVDYANVESNNVYLQVFAIDSPPNGTKPIMQGPQDTDQSGLTQSLNFGDNGIIPSSGAMVAATGFNTNKGCTLALSTTSGSLTIITGTDDAIRAIYGDVSR